MQWFTGWLLFLLVPDQNRIVCELCRLFQLCLRAQHLEIACGCLRLWWQNCHPVRRFSFSVCRGELPCVRLSSACPRALLWGGMQHTYWTYKVHFWYSATSCESVLGAAAGTSGAPLLQVWNWRVM